MRPVQRLPEKPYAFPRLPASLPRRRHERTASRLFLPGALAGPVGASRAGDASRAAGGGRPACAGLDRVAAVHQSARAAADRARPRRGGARTHRRRRENGDRQRAAVRLRARVGVVRRQRGGVEGYGTRAHVALLASVLGEPSRARRAARRGRIGQSARRSQREEGGDRRGLFGTATRSTAPGPPGSARAGKRTASRNCSAAASTTR